jgi:hypothetical protein
MGIKQFFNKIGEGAKKFFKKDGTLDRTFSKGGSAEKLVNKIGAGIDTGLKVVGDVAGKVGRVAGSLAPVLSLVNPELGLGAMALSAGAGKVGGVTKQIKSAKQDAVDAFKGKKNEMISSIMAPKPVNDMAQPEPVNFA